MDPKNRCRMNKNWRPFISCLLVAVFGFQVAGFGQEQKKNKGQAKVVSFQPGNLWKDDRGDTINAHGGGILFANNRYYWFGEKRGQHASQGVNVYSSTDLYKWKFEALALAPDTLKNSDIAIGCLMERPKVIYNAQTKKYVMWFHLELSGQGYKTARAAVAVSD